MAVLNVEISSDTIKGIKDLAVRHYGDDSDSSISRVIEVALEMRLAWREHAGSAGDEIEEPLVQWEFAEVKPEQQRQPDIQSWLFRRKAE